MTEQGESGPNTLIPTPTSGIKAHRALTSRVAPAIAFGLLDALTCKHIVQEMKSAAAHAPTPHLILTLVDKALYVAFVSVIIVQFLRRPSPRSRDPRLSAWMFAMLGTFGLTSAPLLPTGPMLYDSGIAGALVESSILAIALALALVTLKTLGQAFSLTPEARQLVVSGPYRVVRHPLYLFEAVVLLAITVRSGRVTMMILAGAVLAIQVRRAQLEERLLSETFPEYQHAFRGVAHFLPGVY